VSQRDLARLELAWRRAERDVIWCSSHWWIQHPLGSRKWELYDAQREILESWDTRGNYLHLKARQLGFSTSVGFFAWRTAFFGEGKKVLLLSKGERESIELLDKVKFGMKRLPDWMTERGPKILQETQTKITFDNESEIISLPSGSDPARGFTGALVVVDEWAFMEDSIKAWSSIEPVADIGGQLIGLSTANGIDNIFYQLWVKAQDGVGMFTPMFFPWSAVPSRDQAWYQKKKESMLEWQLHQEYPSAPEEAFIKSGSTVFNVAALQAFDTVMEPASYRIEGAGTTNCRLAPVAGNGDVNVYQMPLLGKRYVIGIDIAEGLGHGDYSSIHVLEAETREVVATWHGHMPADLFGEQAFSLGTIYNTALAVIEVNNHGLTTITEMRRLGYPKIWRSRELNKTTRKVSVEFGWRTTRWNKATLIDGLGAWIREATEIWCPGTVRELMSYVRNVRGRMQGSPHDDRVISLALAVHGLEFVMLPEYTEEIDDYMSMDWWLRQGEVKATTTGIRPLRNHGHLP
jgi:hypothetical protein